jgi:two-component system sensor histidine kinase SenX3
MTVAAIVGWCVAVAAVVVATVVQRRQASLRHELDGARQSLDDLHARLSRRRELEGRLAQALEAIELGVVICQADGEVVFRNAAATGFASARHGDALVKAAIDELLALARDGRAGEREVEVYGPPLRSHVVRCFPLWESSTQPGAQIGALALIEESTERRRLDQVRRDFVANISHELRTPVGALGLLAETIQDEPDDETVRRLAGRMVAEADRVAHTIEDLLELSRIEFGDETHIDEIDIVAVVGEASSRMAAAAEQGGVTISTTGLDHFVVRGDRRQLVSALYNLLDNAVKFSAPGAKVEIRLETTGDRVRVSVNDQGVGIPARDLDRIFERFYRVDRARSRGTGGTGLGLAIVRHVAANHGGDVTVSSREGEGSTFSLVLPAGSVSGTRAVETVGVSH